MTDFDDLVKKYRAMGESEIEAEMYVALRALAHTYRDAITSEEMKGTAGLYLDAVYNCLAIGLSLVGPGVEP